MSRLKALIWSGAILMCCFSVPTSTVWADCSSPSAPNGSLNFNYSGDRFEYCDSGDSWQLLGSGSDPIAILVDQKAAGTSGGTFNSGAWRTRDLNTEQYDNIGVTISSNQFTLPAGTYEIDARVPSYRASVHQARLYNVTDAAVALVGTSEYGATGGNYVTNESTIKGVISIVSAKTFEIQHQGSSSFANQGFGVPVSHGEPEIYTTIYVRKINPGASGGGGADTLNDLTDVSVAGATDGQALTFNGASWVASDGAERIQDSDGDTSITLENTGDTDTISFTTAGTERMVIDASGNVGIGTAHIDTLYVNGEQVTAMPTGFIGMFNLVSCPSGWTLVSESQGRFPRGIDVAGTTDPSGTRVALTTQIDTFASHSHTVENVARQNGTNLSGGGGNTRATGVDRESNTTGDDETRPKNFAILFCSKN